MNFYTHLNVYGDVENLHVSERGVVSDSNITVYGTKNVLEIHGEILIDQPGGKKRCALPANTVISLLSIFAQGNVVIADIEMAAINSTAFPLLVTLIEGAKLRAGLHASHVFCKLESGASVNTFKRHGGVTCRWTVADFEARLQPGCSIQGLSITGNAKFVLTAAHLVRPTVGDVTIKPGASLLCVPRSVFEKMQGFDVVRESLVAPMSARVAELTTCSPKVKSDMELVLMRSMRTETRSTPIDNFYNVTYRHEGKVYSVVTHSIPPDMPAGAIITRITPLGSDFNTMSFSPPPPASTLRRDSLPPALRAGGTGESRKRPAPEYRLVISGEALQAVLDESRAMAEQHAGPEEVLDLSNSFALPKEFKDKNEPFFVIEGPVPYEDRVQESREGRCVMCMENAAVVIFSCRHRVMCYACAETSRFLTDVCPTCKKEITEAFIPY